MLDTTVTLARSFGSSPFEMMGQDCDEVILFINYFIWKADHKDAKAAANPAKNGDNQKIKVNNKTATGGWW